MGNRSSSSSPAAADGTDSGSGCTSTMAAETSTGWHVLRVRGYSQARGVLGPGNCVESGCFAVGGHTWCIQYYPDGVDMDGADWIGVFLALHRPAAAVKARYKIGLLGQDGRPVAAHTFQSTEPRTFSPPPGAPRWGFHRFVKRYGGVLQEGPGGVLKDDCLSIGCEVTVVRGVGAVDSSATRPPGFVFVTVPPPDLGRDLGELLSGGRGADVTFEVGGELSPAHRSVLAARSPVFRAELLGPMSETTAAAPIQVRDIDPGVFRAMLVFVYTDALPAAGGGAGERAAMAQHLLVAADRYDLRRLKLICDDALCGQVSRVTAATTLVLADQHGCRGLKEACLAFLACRENFLAVMGTEEYDHLRRSCPLLHDELVARLAPGVFKGKKVRRSPHLCFFSRQKI